MYSREGNKLITVNLNFITNQQCGYHLSFVTVITLKFKEI